MRCQRLSRLLGATLCLGGISLSAQSPPEIREILNRLQKLEESNQALLDEVRALRKELAAAHAPSSEPAPVSAARMEEKMNVQSARIEEMADSKVESSQKLPLRVTGMALFNAYVNGRSNG